MGLCNKQNCCKLPPVSSYMFLCFRACFFIGKHVLQFIVIACLCVSSPCSTALHKTQYHKFCNCIEANSRNPLNLFKEGRMCVCADQGNEFHELSEYIKKIQSTKYQLCRAFIHASCSHCPLVLFRVRQLALITVI